MKRVVIVLSLLLLITSCASNGGVSSQAPDTELVSCNTIQQITENVFDPLLDLSLDCLDGSEAIKLSMIKGPAVINVWASWCASCEEELPFFKEFSKINGEKVQFIGIDVEEKSATVGANFAKKNKCTWAVSLAFISPSGQVFDRTGVSEQRVITREVQLRSGRTIYSHLGDMPFILIMIASLLALLIAGRRTTRA